MGLTQNFKIVTWKGLLHKKYSFWLLNVYSFMFTIQQVVYFACLDECFIGAIIVFASF